MGDGSGLGPAAPWKPISFLTGLMPVQTLTAGSPSRENPRELYFLAFIPAHAEPASATRYSCWGCLCGTCLAK